MPKPPKLPIQLILDSLESTLRMSETRRNRRDQPESDRCAWCSVSVEASKALLQACVFNQPNVTLDKKRLEDISSNLCAIAKFANLKACSMGGVLPRDRIPLPVKQAWAKVAIDANIARLQAIQAIDATEQSTTFCGTTNKSTQINRET